MTSLIEIAGAVAMVVVAAHCCAFVVELFKSAAR